MESGKGYLLRVILIFSMVFSVNSCVSPGSAVKKHTEKMEEITGHEYHIPKRPVDRHYIGAVWSKQFGPIYDPPRLAGTIPVKLDKSFDSMQEDYAFRAALGLGVQTIIGPSGEIGVESRSIDRTMIKGVQIISPISLADIPFKPNVPYVTEALRLEGFALKSEKKRKAGVNVGMGVEVGNIYAGPEIGGENRVGTAGKGLVVGYKLHTIDVKSYKKTDSGALPMNLERVITFPDVDMTARARLLLIKFGSKKGLPGNVIWACKLKKKDKKDMVAAWVIDIKFTDRRKKSMSIAFPAFPRVEDCDICDQIVFSKIDPLTDRIIRQRLNIIIQEAELDNALRPSKWDATIALVEESFKIKLLPADKMKYDMQRYK